MISILKLNVSNTSPPPSSKTDYHVATSSSSSSDLNEKLVKLLIQRDDLHMEQDSMLVDIEDLTRYL